MKRSLVFATIIGLSAVLVTPGCVNRAAQAQAKRTEEIIKDKAVLVTTAVATSMPMSETLDITGQIVTSDTASVGAKVAGRLASVNVKDGDSVQAGQVLAVQETSIQNAQLRQALAQLSSAQSQLSQAKSNAAIAPQRTAAAVAAAESQLRSAKSQLDKARKGARTEEIAQAEWNVRSAKANMETAKKELDRVRELYKEGAVPLQRVEQAQNAYEQALAGYNGALEAQRVTQNATRPEDLRAAEEAVRQAEENVRSAKAQKALDVTLNDQVMGAVAAVNAAQAQVDIVRQQIADATIRAPFSGRVSGRPAQPGTVLNPGQTVVNLVGSEGIYFEGEVPEVRLAEVQIGKAVEITVDAFPNRPFTGRVVSINPLGSDIGRMFTVRVQFERNEVGVQPGMFARGVVTVKRVEDAIVLPITALLKQDDKTFVFVVQQVPSDPAKNTEAHDSVKKVEVRTGLTNTEFVQVIGIAEGAKVIVKGVNAVIDGSVIKEDQPKKDTGAATSEGA
ncbi:MAG: efflux RND transporter periplasmic adaptor subunit [Fimbriimonadaceae bacterium]|nr:efflux RND transporter periplasmic adaptor subunit [Fimbriimonadaceae bacterium]